MSLQLEVLRPPPPGPPPRPRGHRDRDRTFPAPAEAFTELQVEDAAGPARGPADSGSDSD